jgi:hypothetical protein
MEIDLADRGSGIGWEIKSKSMSKIKKGPADSILPGESRAEDVPEAIRQRIVYRRQRR